MHSAKVEVDGFDDQLDCMPPLPEHAAGLGPRHLSKAVMVETRYEDLVGLASPFRAGLKHRDMSHTSQQMQRGFGAVICKTEESWPAISWVLFLV